MAGVRFPDAASSSAATHSMVMHRPAGLDVAPASGVHGRGGLVQEPRQVSGAEVLLEHPQRRRTATCRAEAPHATRRGHRRSSRRKRAARLPRARAPRGLAGGAKIRADWLPSGEIRVVVRGITRRAPPADARGPAAMGGRDDLRWYQDSLQLIGAPRPERRSTRASPTPPRPTTARFEKSRPS